MLRRFASGMAGGALALTSYSVLVAAPASAGPVPEPKNTVEVTKVVVGENPGGGFTVEIRCVIGNKGNLQTLTFGPEGGTKSVEAPAGSTCTVEETGTGGASKVEVSGSPCDFPPLDDVVPVAQVTIGETCKVTVTNTFVKAEAGPAGPPGPPGPPGETVVEVQPAQAVVSTARLTG
jgi:uncharacterized protein DUF5979